ncbi:hypothetical protein KEM63_07475 [Halopseudomonas nanhaiensis]|uniref:hypothetical protein n=1 Tax=Halopseudomonas nanhaiensis TaxID=2830842 RepID=UPI001CBD4139|nr:hypothetical protein [Halopseudomonas nanhaiensis]UAW99794.1 hypothetical protein KEM63_07475 [Halopseudomonas nanhaiensis]
MKPRLIMICASVALASAFSIDAMAQNSTGDPVVRDAGEKGGVNLNRFRDAPADEPLELLNTDDERGSVSAEERERELSDPDRRTYQRYDPEKSDLGPDAYRMDPSRGDW